MVVYIPSVTCPFREENRVKERHVRLLHDLHGTPTAISDKIELLSQNRPLLLVVYVMLLCIRHILFSSEFFAVLKEGELVSSFLACILLLIFHNSSMP